MSTSVKDKLAGLTKEQKLQLLDAIEEKARRKREARKAFTPHEEQLHVITDKHAKRIVVSGNGWGKSSLGSNEAIWALDGYNPITKEHTAVPARVIVVLDSPEKVADVWLPELRKWRDIKEEQLHKRGKPYFTEITWPNGSSLRFMFQEQNELAFESISKIDFCIFDEPPDRSTWIALLRGGREKNRKSRYLLIGTPLSRNWLREYYVEWQKGQYPDTAFFRGSTMANKDNLAAGYIEEFSSHLTETEKRTRLHGEFFNTDGMALAGLWKREQHIIREPDLPHDYKQAWPHVISIDPHANKPTYACLLAAAPNGRRYYVAEISLKVVPREFANFLKQSWLTTHRVVDIICDNAGQADYTGGEGFSSFIEVLNKNGVRVRATTYDEKSADDFMERLQEGLFIPANGEPLLQFLLGHSSGVIKDIENVQWKKQKGTEEFQPKLEIGNTDYLACLKYALAANLTFENAKRKIIKPPTRSPWAGNGKKGYMEERLKLKNRRLDDDDDDDFSKW
jgi:hypothetical protein